MVDLNFGNSIVEAFARGQQEKLEGQKLAQEKFLKQQELDQNAQRIQAEADRLKAETANQNALMNIAKANAAQAAQEHQLNTGQAPAGYTEQQSAPVPYAFKNGGETHGTGDFSNPTLGTSFKAINLQDVINRTKQMLAPKTDEEIRKEGAKLQTEQTFKDLFEQKQQAGRVTLEGIRGTGRMDVEKYRQGQENYRAGLKTRTDRSDNQVRILAQAHDNNPLTADAVQLREATQYASGIPNESKNPADNIGLIYAFAKAMDPRSTVREGEYATVQKYAQSWKDRFGFDVNRIFNGENFLTPQAKAQLKEQIAAKAQATGQVYSDYRNNIKTRIKSLSKGEINPDEYLGVSPADFGKSASAATSTGGSSTNPLIPKGAIPVQLDQFGHLVEGK